MLILELKRTARDFGTLLLIAFGVQRFQRKHVHLIRSHF
jgi:hypothetical protein